MRAYRERERKRENRTCSLGALVSEPARDFCEAASEVLANSSMRGTAQDVLGQSELTVQASFFVGTGKWHPSGWG